MASFTYIGLDVTIIDVVVDVMFSSPVMRCVLLSGLIIVAIVVVMLGSKAGVLVVVFDSVVVLGVVVSGDKGYLGYRSVCVGVGGVFVPMVVLGVGLGGR